MYPGGSLDPSGDVVDGGGNSLLGGEFKEGEHTSVLNLESL